MEQQKILWIVFSVTLFLLVVVVVGFVWFLPSQGTDETPVAEGSRESAVFDPIVWVRDGEDVPGLTEEPKGESPEEDILLVYGDSSENGGADETGEQPAITVVKTTGRRLEAPASTAESGRSVSVAQTSGTAAVSSQASAQPSQSTRRPVVTATVPKTQSSAKPVAAPRTVTVTQYWIQAGSYRSQSRAELTRDALAAKGWNGRIVSRDVSGELFFRVRVGPYETQGEARKFLSWLHDLDSFETSYISEVYSKKTLN